jgi:hypothetical protein
MSDGDPIGRQRGRGTKQELVSEATCGLFD